MKYYLMHRDDRAALLDIDTRHCFIEKIQTIERSLLPPGLQGGILNDPVPARIWWEDRALPKSRPDVIRLFAEYCIESTARFLLDNLALGMNDCYWICPKDTTLSWKEVSLFHNDFEGDLARHLKRGGLGFTPAASTGGELEKRWERRDGNIYMVKGNMPGKRFHQSLNEVFASNLHKRQGFENHVEYSLCGFEEGITGCISQCFTSEEVELVPAWQVMRKYKKRSSQNNYSYYLECMEREGIDAEDARLFMDYQSTTDFLTTNLDRHYNNFGLLRDSRTLKMITPAPIFDSGNSMMHSGLYKSSPLDLLERSVVSLCNTEGRMMAQVKSFDAIDLDKLPEEDGIKAFYKQDPMLFTASSTIAQAFSFKRSVLSALKSGFRFSEVENAIRGYCSAFEDVRTLGDVADEINSLGPEGFVTKFYLSGRR